MGLSVVFLTAMLLRVSGLGHTQVTADAVQTTWQPFQNEMHVTAPPLLCPPPQEGGLVTGWSCPQRGMSPAGHSQGNSQDEGVEDAAPARRPLHTLLGAAWLGGGEGSFLLLGGFVNNCPSEPTLPKRKDGEIRPVQAAIVHRFRAG